MLAAARRSKRREVVMRGLFWRVHRGSGSKSCRSKEVVLGRCIRRKRNMPLSLFREIVASARLMQVARLRTPLDRDNAYQAEFPARTCTNLHSACGSKAQSPLVELRMRCLSIVCTRNNALFWLLRVPCVGACSVPASGRSSFQNFEIPALGLV